MSVKDVVNRFALVSGFEQEKVSQWFFVIIDCIKYFEGMLGDRKLTDIQKRRITHACAVYAYYKYSLINFASKSSKLKAGDLEIQTSEDLCDHAHRMWQQEKKEIADIIDFDNFCFVRVC